jgi:hypothetical protein
MRTPTGYIPEGRPITRARIYYVAPENVDWVPVWFLDGVDDVNRATRDVWEFDTWGEAVEALPEFWSAFGKAKAKEES